VASVARRRRAWWWPEDKLTIVPRVGIVEIIVDLVFDYLLGKSEHTMVFARKIEV